MGAGAAASAREHVQFARTSCSSVFCDVRRRSMSTNAGARAHERKSSTPPFKVAECAPGTPPDMRAFAVDNIRLAIAVFAGVVAGMGFFTFGYAEGLSYFSSDPKACANCHIMNDQYDS